MVKNQIDIVATRKKMNTPLMKKIMDIMNGHPDYDKFLFYG